MSCDYTPHDQNQLAGWADQFVAFAEAHAAEIGLTEDELIALIHEHEAFDNARIEYNAVAARARGACKTKNQARRSLVERMRQVSMRIQASPAISDGERRGLGLSLGLPQEYVPLELSDERPLAVIDGSQRLRHVLRIANLTPTGSAKARPGNATGCEVWMTVGELPPDPGNLQYIGTVSNGLRVVDFPGECAGKKAYYRLRWVGRRSTAGNWSDTFSATIAA